MKCGYVFERFSFSAQELEERSTWLRWTAVEAALHAGRFGPRLGCHYGAFNSRHGQKGARVALAGKPSPSSTTCSPRTTPTSRSDELFHRYQALEGKLEAHKEVWEQTIEQLKGCDPCAVGHVAYLNEEGTEAKVFHIYPEAELLALHMQQGAGELGTKSLENMDIVSVESYGRPRDEVLARVQAMAGTGVGLEVKSDPRPGYLRLESG